MKHWSEALVRLRACEEAVKYAKDFATFSDAWKSCERGDWMLWLAGRQCKTPDDRRPLVLAACQCARLSLKHVPKDEKRPLKAIQTVEAWAKGDQSVSLGDVRDVAHAVYAAYTADNAAAHAVYAAVYAAAYTAYAADNAVYAVYAAIEKINKKCADIVREFYEPSSKGIRLVVKDARDALGGK